MSRKEGGVSDVLMPCDRPLRRWDAVNKECVYRKCDEQCPDGDVDPGSQKTGKNEFEYEGTIYRRQWWCCNDRSLCNGKEPFPTIPHHTFFL